MGQYMQLGITRGFWALAARNLLYYQAELTSLERELVQLENQDSNCVHDERREFAGSWEKLSGATGAKGEQWRKFREIRGVLKDYCARRLTTLEMGLSASMLTMMQMKRLSKYLP